MSTNTRTVRDSALLGEVLYELALSAPRNMETSDDKAVRDVLGEQLVEREIPHTFVDWDGWYVVVADKHLDETKRIVASIRRER